ncbi:MAG: hydrogenase small subunit [Berryella intestinalis]|uniref:hydrogenase small subunit n=1 Tax=Berryella intestinalis TaxID=1531429 RepID=UPI002A535328|nr:hydrogenase small subunit [Berryella intestinalis]MDD7369854.1 hydrogenase small subunit [Berryella intestinalis]MDY3129595.1 hydrogenase small subunit [Berryella intestinalis]
MEQGTVAPEFEGMLSERGVSRRSFMKFCGALAVAAGMSELAAPKVAEAVEASVIGSKEGKLYPVLWIEGASCTGCTESFAQLETPDVGTVVLEMLSLNYSDVLSAGAGESLELAKEQTIAAGNYLLVYEGAVVQAWGGNALRVAAEPGIHHLEEAAKNAKAVVALGSCAVNGGWMSAAPNAADATGVQAYLKKVGIEKPVINVPGCPANPEHLMAVLTEVLMLGSDHLQLDSMNRPSGIFGQTVHDNCERRGHFENGEFVYKFGSKEEELGYCLYPLGCRGPQTNSNCGVTMWNNRRSWCVQSGAPCIGCCEADPNNIHDNWVDVNTPFYERHRDLRIGDWTVQPYAVAFAVTGAVAAALVVHGFGMKAVGRMDGGADFEEVRKWDAKHPDKSVGQYEGAFKPEKKHAAKASDEEGR